MRKGGTRVEENVLITEHIRYTLVNNTKSKGKSFSGKNDKYECTETHESKKGFTQCKFYLFIEK